MAIGALRGEPHNFLHDLGLTNFVVRSITNRIIPGVKLSIGDLLRGDALRPSLNRGLQIEIIMSNVSLVSYYYVRKILDFCLSKRMQNGRVSFLIDGFSRSRKQAQFFDGEESIIQKRFSGKRD